MDKTSPKTALLYDERFLEHDTGVHPESPKRLMAIIKHLKSKDIWDGLLKIETKPADLKWITLVHGSEYIKRFEKACIQKKTFMDSGDTPISEKSYETARLACGAVLEAVDAVMSGKARNAFCAIRPPGHHAKKDRAMGFCFFGNVAVAVKYAREKYKLKKALIVDWDVHHGNGTQDAFYRDPDILFFSIHQHPFYPGTGAKSEIGEGLGKGLTINVPLAKGAGDKEYLDIFRKVLEPAALKFKPDIVFISAGFDAYKDDPLGQMSLTEKGFAEMTEIVMGIADETAHGRIISVLEGGYDLKGLSKCVEFHLRVLMKK